MDAAERADVFAGDGDHEPFVQSLRIAKGRVSFALSTS